MTQGVLSKDTLFCPGGFGLTGGGNDGSPVEDSAPEFPVGRQGGIQPLPKARIAFQHGHIVDGIGQGFRRLVLFFVFFVVCFFFGVVVFFLCVFFVFVVL